MPKVEDTKIRVLAVAKILRDRAEGATVKEILEALNMRYDIKTQRSTIYRDLMAIDRLHPVEFTGQAGGYKWRFMR